jgi:DNA-binding MarR family transcriptional regulator
VVPDDRSASPPPDDALIDALAQTAFVVTDALQRAAAAHDLSLTQLRVLGILRDRRLRPSALAAHVGIERSSLSGLLDRAEQRGLLDRRPDPLDGRASTVGLTARARKLTRAVEREVRDALTPLADAWSPRERERLTALLAKAAPEP